MAKSFSKHYTATGHWTKVYAVEEFNYYIKPYLPRYDFPAHREAWNNYTDGLHKDGLISDRQYQNWGHPAYTISARDVREWKRRGIV